MPPKQTKKPTRSPAVKQPGTGHPARSISLRPAWERRLKELEAFKKEHGHCRVSTLSKDHASLGCWVRTMRVYRRRGELGEEQIRRLTQLGFVWDGRGEQGIVKVRMEAAWELKYAALVKYQRAHGHCRVSARSKDHARLGRWIRLMREYRRQGRLSEEQMK